MIPTSENSSDKTYETVRRDSASPESPMPRVEKRSVFRGGSLEAMRALVSNRSVRAALFAFVLTRSIILFLIVFTAQINVFDPELRATRISLHKVQVARAIKERVKVGDVDWYIEIAHLGYERRPFTAEKQENWAFFPLFPLVLRLASTLTGEFIFTGMALSGIFFFSALVLLHKTVLEFGLSDADADRAVFYLAAFPVSYFFSLGLTESLFLMLVVGSFYLAKREVWWAAALLGTLASATRVTGVLLLPALAVLYWQTYRTFRVRPNFLPLLLIPAGLLAFMFFLYRSTGNPLAFKDVAVAWGREPGFFLLPLLNYLSDPLLVAEPWDFRLVNFLAATAALVCGVVLLKWRQWALATFTLSSMLVTLSTNMLQSQARYAMVVFPVFIVLAVAGRSARVDTVIRTASLIILILLTVMFCQSLDIVLS